MLRVHFRKMRNHLGDILERPFAGSSGGTTGSGQEVLGSRAETALPVAEALEGRVLLVFLVDVGW